MLRKLHILLIGVVITFAAIVRPDTLCAQEQFHSNQFIYSAHAINPAFNGIEDLVNLNMGFRKQWAAIQEAPTTYYLGFNGSISGLKSTFSNKRSLRTSVPRLYKKNQTKKGAIQHGLGFYLNGDSFGPFRRTSIFLGYSFIYSLSEKYKLSIGLSSEFQNQRFNADDISVYNPDQDAVYQQYANGAGNETYINIIPGAVLYGEKFFIGYSAHQLMDFRISGEDAAESNQYGIYHYLIAGYNIPLSSQVIFQPSTFVKYNTRYPVVVDLLLKLKYREVFWGGLSYRYDDAFGFQMGFQMTSKLYVAYSYEAYTSDIGPYSKGTHELILGYRVFNDKVSRPLLW
jgi:type IX secretion system PorP/SprF family membrane protein